MGSHCAIPPAFLLPVPDPTRAEGEQVSGPLPDPDPHAMGRVHLAPHDGPLCQPLGPIRRPAASRMIHPLKGDIAT